MGESEITTIPQLRRVFYSAYGNFPTVGIKTEDLAYATDRYILYRWNGAAWEVIAYRVTMALNKLLLGQGLGSNPIEVDMPSPPNNPDLAFAVDDNLRHSNDAEKTVTTATLTKLKEKTMTCPLVVLNLMFTAQLLKVVVDKFTKMALP